MSGSLSHAITPCRACNGRRFRHYSSGSTWRGGMGPSSITMDICDRCWGSGDDDRPWTDIRALEERLHEHRVDEGRQWLCDRLGIRFKFLRPVILYFAEVIEAQGRKRKVPEGLQEWEFRRSAEIVPAVLRELAKDYDAP